MNTEQCDRCKYPEPKACGCHSCPKCNRPGRVCVIIIEQQELLPCAIKVYTVLDDNHFIGMNI